MASASTRPPGNLRNRRVSPGRLGLDRAISNCVYFPSSFAMSGTFGVGVRSTRSTLSVGNALNAGTNFRPS